MILCCGEALIDMIPTPTVAGQDGFVPHVGGAVFNTAIGLGRLGARVGMLTGVSSDMFGQQLTEALLASHVDVSRVVTSQHPTTLAFVRLADGQATYSFYDENTAGRMLSLSKLAPLPDDVTALFFGGISLACEPGATTYEEFLLREGGNRVVMIDPNIRPAFIQDEVRYRARLNVMMQRADIVKVSDEDLNWIEPSDIPMREKVERLLENGPSLVIVTRGGKGATGFLSGGAKVHVPVEKVDVVDTVGAGDTFNAGVLAKLSELGALKKTELGRLPTETLHAALTHGARVAAKVVSRSGANPPWVDEL